MQDQSPSNNQNQEEDNNILRFFSNQPPPSSFPLPYNGAPFPMGPPPVHFMNSYGPPMVPPPNMRMPPPFYNPNSQPPMFPIPYLPNQPMTQAGFLEFSFSTNSNNSTIRK